MRLVEYTRKEVRKVIRLAAVGLQYGLRGKISPNTITIIGTLMHVPIAWLIATEHNILAAILLIVFGLFDTLDGELARLQGSASRRGMLLDASTDRLKEVALYTGAAYALANSPHPAAAAFAAAACGASVSVSYVKAKGEAAFAILETGLSHDALNRLFKDGLLTFELRMVLLIVGLAVNQLAIMTAIIAVLAAATALQRLVKISRKLT
jgi:CDP-diacylglycerol--glycerol-3-phosphate 3-phosphatidyltransferase